ncbi:hypothetical protein, partial [Pseudomonas carnis]|uniref:hypothetical protein n=1 Tax=Pseudomonas carnis TaxID=2487355 RepID=UPI001E5581A4
FFGGATHPSASKLARHSKPAPTGICGVFQLMAFSITERWFIEMQILRTGRPLHDPRQTPTA